LAVTAVATVPALRTAAVSTPVNGSNRYCAFIKFLRSLKYEDLAERIAEMGFGGVEATIRSNDGYILPEKAAEELPKFKKVLEKNGLELSIVTTDILSADQRHADSVLRAAADAGTPRYRLGFYRYDLKKPIVGQIQDLRPKFERLAELNRKVGITGMYQNHAGADMFGSTLWDLYYLLRDHAPDELSCVYDLRHAAVEAGESWPTVYSVIRPHVTAYSVKDFKWNGRKSQHAPLGEGMVDPEFYKSLAKSDYKGPISLHVEYLKESVGADGQLAAIKRDFATLRKWMAA
jgi:sugar phosphate isomerase/epimerase